MKRRNVVKAIAIGTVTPQFLFSESTQAKPETNSFKLSQNHFFESSRSL